MRGIALAGIHVDDRQREIARRNDVRIVVLAGTAGADETVLGALIAFDLGVLERGPVRLLVLEAADIFFHDLFERNTFEFLRARMTGDGHGLLLNVRVGLESILVAFASPSFTVTLRCEPSEPRRATGRA